MSRDSTHSFSRFDDLESLKSDLEQARSKLEEKNNKLRQYKQVLSDYKLKNQLLEEENKLLQATRISQPQKNQEQAESMVSTAKVNKLMTDFGSLLDSQNKDISALINDRDKLSKICFTSINLLSTQERLLSKFKISTQKLLKYVSRNGETFESIVREYQSLGIDLTSELSKMSRTNQISNIITSFMDGSVHDVETSEIERVLRLLPQSQIDDNNMRTITKFVLDQVSRTKEYESEIQSLKTELSKSNERYHSLVSQLCSASSQNMTFSSSADIIENIKTRIIRGEKAENSLKEISTVFSDIAEKSQNRSESTKKCVSLINAWIENPSTPVDISHEINFLINSLSKKTIGKNTGIKSKEPKEKLSTYSQNREKESESDNSEEYKIKRHRRSKTDTKKLSSHEHCNCCIRNEKAMIKQVKNLKKNVSAMRNKMKKVDEERRCFIKQRLNDGICDEAHWPEICSYILHN